MISDYVDNTTFLMADITMNQRKFLKVSGALAGAVSLTGAFAPAYSWGQSDNSGALAILDGIIETAWLYFMENGDPETGLVRDRSRVGGVDERPQASLAATGFGLTVLALADGLSADQTSASRARIRTTIKFLRHDLHHNHGFFYHFVHWKTGERYWKCELSSIDTSLCLLGVMVCESTTDDDEIRQWCREIFDRVDWTWLLDDSGFIRHGWKPESGFLNYSWNAYSELLHLYILAIGARENSIPPASWDKIEREWVEYNSHRYIGSHGAFFIHQFSHAWIDFRSQRDRHTNYFENSVTATRAHRQFCMNLATQFPEYNENVWGITASDSEMGYVAWGGPPSMGPINGTVVPCAVAGSLPFTPELCLNSLNHMRKKWDDKIWGRYGFVDAFNPNTGWFNPDVIGIDVGISALMAMNLKSESVWKALKSHPVIAGGMEACGFEAVR